MISYVSMTTDYSLVYSTSACTDVYIDSIESKPSNDRVEPPVELQQRRENVLYSRDRIFWKRMTAAS